MTSTATVFNFAFKNDCTPVSSKHFRLAALRLGKVFFLHWITQDLMGKMRCGFLFVPLATILLKLEFWFFLHINCKVFQKFWYKFQISTLNRYWIKKFQKAILRKRWVKKEINYIFEFNVKKYPRLRDLFQNFHTSEKALLYIYIFIFF